MYRNILFAVVALLTLGLLSACDNPVDADDDDHGEVHAEVAGLVLVADDDERVRVANAEVSDTLRIASGETLEIDVEFLDEDGNEVHAEDLDEEYSLGWEVESPGIISIVSTGDWSFSAEALEAGETVLTLRLLHGDHPDFTTPDIPVRVE